MNKLKVLLFTLFLFAISKNIQAQCSQIITVNNIDAMCNGNGTSSVDINLTILFPNGNNSVVISYNLGMEDVNAVLIEDDMGDIIDSTFSFIVPSCGNYTIKVAGWTNPAGSGSECTDPAPIINDIILPVIFGDFDISKKGRDINIEWSTLSETNNEKFVVQRAYENEGYIDLVEIKGAMNSLKEEYYYFTDNNIANGTFYYRIKQVDLDAQYSFSETKTINVNEVTDLRVYPNPAHELITISSNSESAFKVLNLQGEVVAIIPKRSSSIDFDISYLESGVYFIMNSTGSEKTTFIKL